MKVVIIKPKKLDDFNTITEESFYVDKIEEIKETIILSREGTAIRTIKYTDLLYYEGLKFILFPE